MAKIRDLNPFKLKANKGIKYQEYLNLLMNALKITRTDGTALNYEVETFIKLTLIECGAIGYDRLADAWAWCFGEGLNIYGNPTRITFVYRNGKSWQREAYYLPAEVGAYMINALPSSFPLASLIEETTDILANCDDAIKQNIEAVKTPYIVAVKDDKMRLSVEHALQQKQNGQAALIVSNELGDALQSVNINVDFIADKIEYIKTQYRDRLLNKLGIMSANTEKRERVQVGEVNATMGQCVDYIYLLIDTFNKQMESYALPFKMELNAVLEELYTDDASAKDKEKGSDIQ